MGCQKVSADICGKKKSILFTYCIKGSLGENGSIFFLSAVKKNVTDLHIFVCTIVCVCVFFFFKFSFLFFLVGSDRF